MYANLKGILPRMMQICMIIYTHLAYTRMTEMLYIYVIPKFLMNSNTVFRQFTMPNQYFNMSIYHDKIELVDYTFIRYRAVFIFIWECTRLLPNEIYSVSVKYIFDYKVKFLRYTRTYSLNGRGRRGMIFF